jgi:hypothetical protein
VETTTLGEPLFENQTLESEDYAEENENEGSGQMIMQRYVNDIQIMI